MTPADELPTAEQVSALIDQAERSGIEALARGDTESAHTVFNELLGLQPSNPTALVGLGDIAAGQGERDKAETLYRKAAKDVPASPLGHRRLAEHYLDQGRSSRARRSLDKARTAAPDDPDLVYLSALIENLSGHRDKWLALLRETLEMAPEHINANNDLGCLLADQGHFDEAIRRLDVAASHPAATQETVINLGNALLLAGRFEEACQVLVRALDRQPDDPGALAALATAERRAGKLEEARLHAEKALALDDGNPSFENLAGTIYRELGQFDEAEQHFTRALEIRPDDPNATSNLALLQLLDGDWANGLVNYERRLDVAEFKRPWGKLPLPEWNGEDLEGKNVIVCSEQGFGDTIQFCRFVADLSAHGAHIKFAMQPELERLMAGLDVPFDAVHPNDKLTGLDYQAMLMSLPRCLGLKDPEDLDGTAYITAPDANDMIADALAALEGVKVGINWRGSTLHKENFKRSMTPEDLAPLLASEGVSFVRLDVGAMEELPGTVDLRHLIEDFADAAAIVSGLDLVITVDTATLHLAGALGKPCIGMISYVPDWRYMLERADSPWYASLELLRQPAPGDWAPVVAAAAERLKSWET